MSVVFFGTSKYCLPVLETLKRNFNLKLVVGMPDKPVGRKKILTPCATKKWAIENEIDYIDSGLRQNYNFDIGIVADYGRIIKPEEFNIPKLGVFNIHFSKLPEFRGASPVQFTLLRGDTIAWVTIIKIDKGLDTGPILWQKSYPIKPNDTTESLYTRLFELVANDLPSINFAGPLTQQDHTKATFTRFLTREDGFVKYDEINNPENYNKFRAYFRWPGIWTLRQAQGKQKRVKILKCHLKNNQLVLDEVQFEGEKPKPWKF